MTLPASEAAPFALAEAAAAHPSVLQQNALWFSVLIGRCHLQPRKLLTPSREGLLRCDAAAYSMIIATQSDMQKKKSGKKSGSKPFWKHCC
jgi:hypothetical protein